MKVLWSLQAKLSSNMDIVFSYWIYNIQDFSIGGGKRGP